jgi:F0F1-type ATP synthase assembly protein I
MSSGIELLQTLVCWRRMEPARRQSFQPAGAGALLLATTGAGIGIGALIGWAAGSWTLGALGGAVAGIPAGVFAVYRRYRGYFS